MSFASGATSGTYTSGIAVGDGLVGTGWTTGAVVTSASGGTFTWTTPTTAASSGSYTAYAASNFTDAAVSTGNVFTTAGLNGGQADIGVTAAVEFLVVGNLSVPFGGASGLGAGGNCLETGYNAAETPALAQTGEASPGFPPPSLGGPGTPLLAASGGFIVQPGTTAAQGITPPTAASVTLTDAPPTPNSQTISVGEGAASVPGALTAGAGSYPVASYAVVGGNTQTIPDGNNPPGTGTVTINVTGSTGAFTISNTSTAANTVHFTFNACDGQSPAVCSTTPATLTVVIGTPPVIQPFTEQVTGGQLVLSCDSPANYITPAGQNQSPAPTGSNPLLQCPEFQFPAITLDGLEQTVTGTTGTSGPPTPGNPSNGNPGTIYISDNRGSPLDNWTLTGTFVPTATGPVSGGGNPNVSCAGVDAFCNSSIGSAALNTATNGAHNGQIAPNYLQVGSISCVADSSGGTGTPAYNPPNLNPNATPTAGGNFGAPVTLCAASTGQSGGTFLYNATYSLTIPESVYAGNYVGSVQYTVA